MIIKSRWPNIIWGFAIISAAFAYPVQVVYGEEGFFIMPYVFLSLIIIFRMYFSIINEKKVKLSSVDYLIAFFILYIVLYLTLSLLLGSLSLGLFMSLTASYVMPVMFYIAIRYDRSTDVVNTILYLVFISGLILSVFLIYETASKLIFGNIVDYTQAAFNYRIDRIGVSIEDANTYQIKLNARAYGLLSNHTVNAAYIAISAFAALLYYYDQPVKRIYLFIYLLTVVIISMSFTIIVATLVAVFVVAFQAIYRKNITLVRLVFLLSFLLIFIVLASVSDGENLLKGDDYFNMVINFLGSQINQVFATGGKSRSIIEYYSLISLDYLDYLMKNPFFLVFGDGFSGIGIAKGGDIGLIETISRFGLILSIFLITSFVVIIRKSLVLWKVCKNTNMVCSFSFLLFVPVVLIVVMASELHYGIYPYRSISSLIYIVLGIYANYRQNLYTL